MIDVQAESKSSGHSWKVASSVWSTHKIHSSFNLLYPLVDELRLSRVNWSRSQQSLVKGTFFFTIESMTFFSWNRPKTRLKLSVVFAVKEPNTWITNQHDAEFSHSAAMLRDVTLELHSGMMHQLMCQRAWKVHTCSTAAANSFVIFS